MKNHQDFLTTFDFKVYGSHQMTYLYLHHLNLQSLPDHVHLCLN